MTSHLVLIFFNKKSNHPHKQSLCSGFNSGILRLNFKGACERENNFSTKLNIFYFIWKKECNWWLPPPPRCSSCRWSIYLLKAKGGEVVWEQLKISCGLHQICTGKAMVYFIHTLKDNLHFSGVINWNLSFATMKHQIQPYSRPGWKFS